MTDLPPGRELDALVAEKVMGWTEVHFEAEWIHWYGSGEEVIPANTFGRHPQAIGDSIIPRYSTSIADAWKVVGQMRAHGYRLVLWTPLDDDTRIHCTAQFENGHQNIDGEGESAPHAICRAALSTLAD